MGEVSLPTYAKMAAGLQMLVGIIVLVFWGIWSTWGKFPYSLLVSGVVFFPALALCLIAILGLLEGRMFGWVTGLIGNGVSAAILFFSAGPFGILPAAALIYLLVPKVRDFYVRDYYR